METCSDPLISGESSLPGKIFRSIVLSPVQSNPLLYTPSHGDAPTSVLLVGTQAPKCFFTGSKGLGPTGLGSPLNHFPVHRYFASTLGSLQGVQVTSPQDTLRT